MFSPKKWGVITLKLSLQSILEVFLCLSENMVSKMPWFVIIVFSPLIDTYIYIYVLQTSDVPHYQSFLGRQKPNVILIPFFRDPTPVEV
jgi:hypothetical protein